MSLISGAVKLCANVEEHKIKDMKKKMSRNINGITRKYEHLLSMVDFVQLSST